MTKPNNTTNNYASIKIRPDDTTNKYASIMKFVNKPIVRLIMTNPWLILITLGFMVILIVYFISSANTYLTQLVGQYSSLSAKVSNSKAQYDKKLFYLTENLDGTVSVTIGFRSEEEQRQAEEAVEEAASPTAPAQSIQLSADAQAVEDLLATQPAFAAKAHALAAVYDKVNSSYGTNAAIGFMANIAAEGNFGQVEQEFSFSEGRRRYEFNMPSSGDYIKTKEDVEYLRQWPSTWSTGFGMVQWSFGRRHNLCDAYLSRLADKPSSYQIPKEVMQEVEVNFFYTESLGYMEYIEGGVARTSDTVENWAEAVCDYYEKPSTCCVQSSIKMTSTGSSCTTRRRIAKDLAELLATLQ